MIGKNRSDYYIRTEENIFRTGIEQIRREADEAYDKWMNPPAIIQPNSAVVKSEDYYLIVRRKYIEDSIMKWIRDINDMNRMENSTNITYINDNQHYFMIIDNKVYNMPRNYVVRKPRKVLEDELINNGLMMGSHNSDANSKTNTSTSSSTSDDNIASISYVTPAPSLFGQQLGQQLGKCFIATLATAAFFLHGKK